MIFFRKTIIYIILIFSVSSVSSVFGQNSNQIRTLFIGIIPVNGAYMEAVNINNLFRERLGKINGLKLVQPNEMKDVDDKAKKCFTRECAVTLGNETGSNRVIYGTINRQKKEMTNQIGSEGEKKYLLQLQKNEYFILTLHLVDIPKSENLASFNKVTYGNFNKDVDEIVDKIQEYYKITAKEIKEPEKIIIDEKVKKNIVEFSLSVNFNYILPLDRFSITSYSGFGLGIQFSMHNLLFRNSFLSIDTNFAYMLTNITNIEYYFLSQASLLLGYSFHLALWLDITPSIGGGYMFHFISGTKDQSQVKSLEMYPDPEIKIQIEFGFIAGKKLIISLVTGYNIFFETTGVGQNLYINAGVRFRL